MSDYQLANLTLQDGVKVVMFKEVTGRCDTLGIDLEGLAGKTVTVTGGGLVAVDANLGSRFAVGLNVGVEALSYEGPFGVGYLVANFKFS